MYSDPFLIQTPVFSEEIIQIVIWITQLEEYCCDIIPKYKEKLSNYVSCLHHGNEYL